MLVTYAEASPSTGSASSGLPVGCRSSADTRLVIWSATSDGS